MATNALEMNWRTGDLPRRDVVPPPRAGAAHVGRTLSELAGMGEPVAAETFAALQLAMLSDTALSASAAQRRRLLVDPAAEEALAARDAAQDALLILGYYQSEIGIRDPDWEAREAQASAPACPPTKSARCSSSFRMTRPYRWRRLARLSCRSQLRDDEML